jgi:indolepyruvate ferredoxin oxidoreductase, beta subunit
MKTDIVLSGVGGQGVLSAAAVIAATAMAQGLNVKQSEVHGMSQRGGEVVANLRISDREIHSDTIPLGNAAMILSFEPLECFRYIKFLKPDGVLISATKPIENMANYPDLEQVLADLQKLPNSNLIDADKIAKDVGTTRAANMVLVGAASKFLPLKAEALESQIAQMFGRKGERIVEINISAFRAGLKITS